MKRYYISRILEKLAAEIGAVITFQPDTYKSGGYITFRSGRRAFFRNNQLGINPYGSYCVVNDKHCAAALMRHFGYKVLPEKLLSWDSPDPCAALEAGLAFAKSIGFPVVVKPRNMSNGHMVNKVHEEAEFRDVVIQLFELRMDALVQQYHPGQDYRIVVFEDDIIMAYLRVPPSIVGDGVSTVKELVDSCQEQISRRGRDARIDIADDRVRLNLKRERVGPGTILPEGRVVRLLSNANMAGGATGYEVTEQIHPTYRDLCIRLCRDMGLRLCGVDLLTADIAKPLGDYVILEANATPGLRHFAALGELQEQKVHQLFRRMLLVLEAG